MMRVGVISDTHGVSFGITRALRAIPDAEAWIHLGDFAADAHTLEREAGVPVHSVRGNCDLDTRVPAELVLTLGGARPAVPGASVCCALSQAAPFLPRSGARRCSRASWAYACFSSGSKRFYPCPESRESSIAAEGRAPSVALLKIENGELFPEIVLV